MKKAMRLLFAVLLSSIFVLSGCSNGKSILKEENGLYSINKSGNSLKYYSSDESFANFINDFYSRHIRINNGKSIGDVEQGQGRMYQRDAESKYISFYDATENGGLSYSPLYSLRADLDSTIISDYGFAFDVSFLDYSSGVEGAFGGIGWPFVNAEKNGNYIASFNYSTNEDQWTLNGREDLISTATNGNISGFGETFINGSVGEEFVYESPDLTNKNVSIKDAPLIEIAFKFLDYNSINGIDSTIKDIVLSWKIDNRWYDMSYYEFAYNNKKIFANDNVRAWFPVYLHPSWDTSKNIQGLKITLIPEDGMALNLKSCIDYVKLQTDTRLTTNTSSYITSMEEYISYTGDVQLLKSHLSDLRKALMFEIYALDGKSGILKTDYFWGHTTCHCGIDKYGLQTNGWYDCWAVGTINLEANIAFYNSILSMIKLERIASESGIIINDTRIINPYPFTSANKYIAWDFDLDTLTYLANSVKNAIRKPYYYGGLWVPETGRFAWAIYDDASYDLLGNIILDGTYDYTGNRIKGGTPFDNGTTEFNLSAVLSGIATEEQAESIMSWINGDRIVESDNVVNIKGNSVQDAKDLYFYGFAPRVNTNDIPVDISIHKFHRQKGEFVSTVLKEDLYCFGEDIQNGGASLHVSYYDLLARTKYLGADNSFSRFKEIQEWYEAVQGSEGTGASFYTSYYADLTDLYREENPSYRHNKIYALSGGTRGVGTLGLDVEFYESAVLYATIHKMYFGLSSDHYKILNIAPNIPSSLQYMAIENLMFYGVKYDLYVQNNVVILSGIKENSNGKKICVKLAGNENSKVYINNIETNDYSYNNGYITLETDFNNVVIKIK